MARPKKKFWYRISDNTGGYFRKTKSGWQNYEVARTMRKAEKWARIIGDGCYIERIHLVGPNKGLATVFERKI
jgi:hypothetical protein